MIYQESKFLIGSDCLITLNAESKEEADKVFLDLWNTIIEFENKFSRFKLESELSKLNIQAGSEFKASEELVDILQTAIVWSKKTEGLYNPFILPLLQREGYVGSWPKPSNFIPDLDFSDRKLYKIEELKINNNIVKIPKDAALDLGGIGKGYLLKILSNKIPKDISGYWISLGGDIVVSGLDDKGESWKIAVEDANMQGELNKVSNEGSRIAVATSGTNRRIQGKWNHLIDPRTGLSTKSDILTATVVSKDPIEADILASCFVLLESSNAREFCNKFDIDVLLQRNIETKYSRNIIYLGNKHTFIS